MNWTDPIMMLIIFLGIYCFFMFILDEQREGFGQVVEKQQIILFSKKCSDQIIQFIADYVIRQAQECEIIDTVNTINHYSTFEGLLCVDINQTRHFVVEKMREIIMREIMVTFSPAVLKDLNENQSIRDNEFDLNDTLQVTDINDQIYFLRQPVIYHYIDQMVVDGLEEFFDINFVQQNIRLLATQKPVPLNNLRDELIRYIRMSQTIDRAIAEITVKLYITLLKSHDLVK